MTPPKFQTGFRVTILPRVSEIGGWKNHHIGKEAIIGFSNFEKYNKLSFDGVYDVSQPCYSLLIFGKNDQPFQLDWYEENSLELMCSNVAKGQALLKVYKDR